VDIGPPPIGHNQPSLTSASEANVETGVLLLCKEFLVTAIQDRRLDRTHLRVLACFVEFVNRRTAKAWPGRQLIADTLNLTTKTVSNSLLDLRNWGYLIADRERVEEAGNRSLMVYTFGNVDHETIRREIDVYIAKLKEAPKVPPQQEPKSPPSGTFIQSPAPAGLSKSPPSGTVPPQQDFADLSQNRKSCPSGDSNLDTKPTTVELNNSRPVEPELQPKPLAEKRATRLREEWILPKPWGVWAMEHFHISRDQVLGEAARFRDYWVSAPGAKAAKKDWEATWRNWIRGSQERPKYRARKVDAAISPGLTEGHDSGSELDVLLEKARQQGR
jgi:hypothetical protein